MYDELLKKYEEEQLKNGIKPKNTQNVKKKKIKRARNKQDIMYA